MHVVLLSVVVVVMMVVGMVMGVTSDGLAQRRAAPAPTLTPTAVLLTRRWRRRVVGFERGVLLRRASGKGASKKRRGQV